MTDEFDAPLQPWEREDMRRLRKGLEDKPFGGSMAGVNPDEFPIGVDTVEIKATTLEAFTSAYHSIYGRQPSPQEIWAAATKAWTQMNLGPSDGEHSSELTVEKGIPLPTKAYSNSEVISEVNKKVMRLEVGDSIQLTGDDARAARSNFNHIKDRKFLARKVAGGCRVWRTE